uniref:CSON003653 protein n=1 Tax=Culicoides sonorensis TaxID=179676 RepID=A0A336MM13_CULSO
MENNQEIQPVSDVPSIQSNSGSNRLRRNNFTLEPSLFLIVFGWTAVFTNQLVYQTCVDVYHYNETTCKCLGTKNSSNITKEIETEVQPYVANIIMAKQLIEILIGTIMCLRLGPWSDLHGRKPILIVVYLGTLLQFGVITSILVFSSKIQIDPWWYVISAFPMAISGGNTALTTVVFSYISDITEKENRALRNGITQGVILISVLLGSISSGYLNDLESPTFVFALATFCVFLGLIHIILFLTETISDQSRVERCNDLFMPKLYKDMIHTAVKKRPNLDRVIVWLILAAVGLASFCTEGSMTLFYLFVREKFEWTIENYTAYLSVNMTFSAIGSIIALVGLKKLFKVNDTILTIFGYLSTMGQSLIAAMASKTWHMYVSVFVGGIKNISYVTCRSILTNIGPEADIGKINALISAFESLFQLMGSPAFTQLYKATLKTYPGAFNLLSVLIFFIDALLLVIVYAIQAITISAPPYTAINESI